MSDLRDKLTNLTPFQRALDASPLPPGEPIKGETLLKDGWVYRDLPKLTVELFNKFVSIVGEENIRWLTLAQYGGDTPLKRGQLLLSPEGQARLAAYSPEIEP